MIGKQAFLSPPQSVHKKLSFYDQTPKPQLSEIHLPNHYTDHVTHAHVVTPHYVDKSLG